jgi:hypothetical protein
MFILLIRIQIAGCCYVHAKSRFQIILTTHNALITIHYSKIQMSKKNRNKRDRYYKDTKEKTTCKLVVAQASTFCTISNFVVLPMLNNCSKRKVLQSEELLARHVNDKLQMHG